MSVAIDGEVSTAPDTAPGLGSSGVIDPGHDADADADSAELRTTASCLSAASSSASEAWIRAVMRRAASRNPSAPVRSAMGVAAGLGEDGDADKGTGAEEETPPAS